MARRSALVDHQMKHIPKSFNHEATEDFLATGAYRTSRKAGFVQHRSGKQFPMSEHTISSIGKIGAPLFSLGRDFDCGEEWLDFPTMRHYCQTHLSQFRKTLIVDRKTDQPSDSILSGLGRKPLFRRQHQVSPN
jgi:hypothetical protein